MAPMLTKTSSSVIFETSLTIFMKITAAVHVHSVHSRGPGALHHQRPKPEIIEMSATISSPPFLLLVASLMVLIGEIACAGNREISESRSLSN